jgi:hypothetical protein
MTVLTNDERNAEYHRRHAVFDAGWAARSAGALLEDNPHGPAPLPKASRTDAELWANGWLSADEWLGLGVGNWCVEGAKVACVRHEVLSGPSFAGRTGVIVAVHRWGLLGWVTVRFLRTGRQKTDRETFFDLRRGELAPVAKDANC